MESITLISSERSYPKHVVRILYNAHVLLHLLSARESCLVQHIPHTPHTLYKTTKDYKNYYYNSGFFLSHLRPL